MRLTWSLLEKNVFTELNIMSKVIEKLKAIIRRRKSESVTDVSSLYGAMDISAQEKSKSIIKVIGKPRPGRAFVHKVYAKCKSCGQKHTHWTIDGKHYECSGCGQIWEI